MELSCHARHLNAEEAMAFIQKPAATLRPRDRNKLVDLLASTVESQPLCGEFGTWWSERLFDRVCNARSGSDATLLQPLVLYWFQLTKTLLTRSDAYCPLYSLTTHDSVREQWKREHPDGEHVDDLIRHCARFQRIDGAHWTRTFVAGVRSNPVSAEALVAHLSTFLDILDVSQAATCAQAAAEQAVKQPRLRLTFLSLAHHYAKLFAWNAHALVDDALRVAHEDPVNLLPQLGHYLLAIRYNGTTKGVLMEAHNTIHGWVHERELAGDRAAVASMRSSQERFVAHLHGRPPRHTHHAPPDGNVTAKIVVRGSAEVVVEGTVADVSVGRDTTGRGVRILLPGWSVREAGHIEDRKWGDGTLHLNTFSMDRLAGSEHLEFGVSEVVINWRDGTVRSEGLSIRAPATKETFCVVFLTARDQEFERWAKYAQSLARVDYGFAGGQG